MHHLDGFGMPRTTGKEPTALKITTVIYDSFVYAVGKRNRKHLLTIVQHADFTMLRRTTKTQLYTEVLLCFYVTCKFSIIYF